MRWGLAVVLALLAGPLQAQETWQRGAASYVQAAGQGWVVRLVGPTDRYDHDVLGGIPRWSALTVAGAVAVLPQDMVFEDVAPRLWDVTGDGHPEIVVVEADVQRGARLAVWALSGDGADLTRLAATPFIGARHRWLAPVGAGDFDGDGRIEIAYVDRPHLAQELVLLRLEDGKLREIGRAGGFTAHRIGDTVITSAVRPCAGGGAELLLPDGAWGRLLAVRVQAGQLVAREAGPVAGLARAAARPC